MPRRRLVVLVLLAVLVAVALSHPGRVLGKTLLLLPDLIPASPVRPLTWITPDPRLETLSYDYGVGTVVADVYHPDTPGRHGAVILALGAAPLPRRDPMLVRFADGLARAGAVVMIPQSTNLLEGRVLPEEVEALGIAVQLLRSMEDVDPERVGFIGFSVGGALSVMVAEDPRYRDQVAYVNTLGAYFDGQLLLEQIATRSIVVEGERRPWIPSDLTLQVFGIQLLQALEDPSERAQLEALLGGMRSDAEPDLDLPEPVAGSELAQGLTPRAQAVLRLLSGIPPEEFEGVRAALPAEAVERIRAISPVAGGLNPRTPLYVMHDVGDNYIPFTQSRYLVQTIEPPSLRLYTETNIFDHVVPNRPVDPLTFAVGLAQLYRHLYVVGLEFL